MARPPRGFKVRLEPQDEYTHVPDAAANYNESMYFNMFDAAQKVGGWFRIGNRPNRIEPRAIKRRPKPHDLLTVPRNQAREKLLAAAPT